MPCLLYVTSPRQALFKVPVPIPLHTCEWLLLLTHTVDLLRRLDLRLHDHQSQSLGDGPTKATKETSTVVWSDSS